MGKRPAGRSRPEGEAVRHPGVRFSGLEGEGAKGSRISSGVKRRASYGDRRGGASRRCRPDEGRKMIARGRLSPTKEESGSLKGAPMSRRAERPRGLAVATPTAGSPRSGASERSEVAPGAGNDKEAGGPRQSARSVCLPTARRSASCLHGRAKRPRIFAVAKPAASPRDRQSEHSEVCRDRATGKYRLPEGRAGRRAAVVRRVP